ncbi:diguanylate cyclase (GGDEF) domain-containing protein [Alteromonadaceae bacterium Bs31]|nr:diguanylate cyclase (GGDEF) domain-containing protein [Alteromonadaceae bacterium Bs31]
MTESPPPEIDQNIHSLRLILVHYSLLAMVLVFILDRAHMLATGWHFADLIHFLAAAACLAGWYYRNTLKLELLSLVTIFAVSAYATASLISFGFISCAIPLFISALILCSMLFSFRATLILVAIVFLVVIVSGAYFLLLGASSKHIFSSSHPFTNFIVWTSTALSSLLFIPLFADYHSAARKVYLDTLEKATSGTDAISLKQIDPLTGLPAIQILMDRLRHELDRNKREKTIGAVMFIDIDRFKDINAHYGKNAGDAVLRTLSARIASVVRASDTLARIGGDEFVAIFPDQEDQEQVRLIARKLMATIENPVVFGEENIELLVSMGISLFPNHSLSPQQLVSIAQDTAELSKQSGGNNFRIASEEL